jgi:hypothetical protein
MCFCVCMCVFVCVCVCVLVHPFLAKYNQIPCTYVFDEAFACVFGGCDNISYSNFKTKSKNMFMPVIHTRTMEHIKTDISHCLKPSLLSIQIDYIWFPLKKNKYILLRQIQHASSVYKVNM